jgi:SurA N-terminal domain
MKRMTHYARDGWRSTALAGLILVGIAGCASSRASATAVVVRVGPSTITKTMVDRVVREEELEHNGPYSQHPGPSHQILLADALASLISYDWVIGQASDLGLNPTQHEVERTFQKERAASFPTQAAYKKYLKTLQAEGKGIADLLLDVRLTLATERIFQSIANKQRHATHGPVSQTQEQQAIATFVKAWRAKWQAKTICTTGYTIQKCAHYTGPKTPEDPYTLN